jgi:urea transport system ATP-binding protein
MGRNGVGKTTLLQAHHGPDPDRAGQHPLRRRRRLTAPRRTRAALGIGYVPQGRRSSRC